MRKKYFDNNFLLNFTINDQKKLMIIKNTKVFK